MRTSKRSRFGGVPGWQGAILFVLGLAVIVFFTPLAGNALQTLVGWTFPVLYTRNDLASLRSTLFYVSLLFGVMSLAILFNATVYRKHRARGLRHVLVTIGWRVIVFFLFCYGLMAYFAHGFLVERKLASPLLSSGLVEQIVPWLIAAFVVWAMASHFIDGLKPEVRAARREAARIEQQRQAIEDAERWEHNKRVEERERREAERR